PDLFVDDEMRALVSHPDDALEVALASERLSDEELEAALAVAAASVEDEPPSELGYIEVDENDLEPPSSLPDDAALGVPGDEAPLSAPDEAAAGVAPPAALAGETVQDPPASSSPNSVPRPSAAPSASARVVMVVEDDATIREMLTRSLGTEYCVYEAA